MKEIESARFTSVLAVVVMVTLLGWGCSSPDEPMPGPGDTDSGVESSTESTGDEIGRSGGRLVFSLTSDPRTFNPLTALSIPSLRVLGLIHEDLLSFDPVAQRAEPTLLESWVSLPPAEGWPEGTRFRMSLRPQLRFSDGEPLTSVDVAFTIDSALDPAVDSPHKDWLEIEGRTVELTVLDDLNLELQLPAPVAEPGLIFDSLYVLPKHRLGRAHSEGRLATAWGVDTPPEEITGLGPFRLTEYRPGEKLVFQKNPYFWRRDTEDNPLPYLDEIVLLLVPDSQTAMLRLQAREVHLLDGLEAEGFQQLRSGAPSLAARDLGPGTAYEFLFFNLNEAAPEELEGKQRWFRDLSFRKAVSLAVDRQAIADLAYGGRATPIKGHVSPGKSRWFSNEVGLPQKSIEGAKELLAEAGFTVDQTGRLLDSTGRSVELTIVTNSTNLRRSQTATVIQQDLERLGMDVQVVPMDFGALLDRVGNTFNFEIGLLGLGRGGVDPDSDISVLHSSGSNHLWHLGTECPTTDWERRIDELMEQQKSELDPARRKELFDEVQLLVAEYLPIVPLVAPNVLVAYDNGLGNVAPTIFEPSVLWNMERLYWRSERP